MRHPRRFISAWRRLATFSAFACFSLGSLSPARADEPDNKAQARALFESAMSEIKQGRYSDAVCAQLAESQRLDPALGTQYQWARCLENTGKLASAWAVYLDVAELAGSQNLPEQQRYARERADSLKPKLTKLIITVPVDLQQQAAGLEVRRDGVLLTSTQYGLALPIDGGRHEISVVATGRRNGSRPSKPRPARKARQSPSAFLPFRPIRTSVPWAERPHRRHRSLAGGASTASASRWPGWGSSASASWPASASTQDRSTPPRSRIAPRT